MDSLLEAMQHKRAEHKSVADGGLVKFPGSAEQWVDEVSRVRAEFYDMKSLLAAATQNYHSALEREKREERDHQLLIAQEENTSQANLLNQKNSEELDRQFELIQIKQQHDANEAEKQRNHELQMALIQKETAELQIEASRLAAETAKTAQEQTNNSLDKLIDGLGGNGTAKN